MLQTVIGTKVGRTKHMRIMPGGALESEQQESLGGGTGGGGAGSGGGQQHHQQQQSSSMFVGRKLDEHRGAFVLEYPMEKGIINNNGWDAMECLWEVRFCFVGCCFPYFCTPFLKKVC